jgi:hypothetical protein
MNKHYKIQCYSDPGHGWAKISVARLIKLNIAHLVTYGSYYRKGFAYLEEDCDVSLLHKAITDRGDTVEFPTHSGNKVSRIRNYDRYNRLLHGGVL